MKVLIASKICPEAIDELESQHDVALTINGTEDELATAIEDREVLVFRSGVEISRHVLSHAPDLKLLIRAGSGLDNLDADYAAQRGIQLARIPGPGAQAVAELAFGMMINLARQIRINDIELRRGHWTKQSTTGYVLREKVLGIVGAGNIGSRLGRMGAAWGMQPIGCVETPSATKADALRKKGIRLASFAEVVKSADFLSIHVPKSASTANLIDAEALSWMKQNSFLTNLARGGIVDEAALHDALTNGHGPAGAALDVHQDEGDGSISPLASLPNVLLTPHIGATTVDTMREIGQRIIDTLDSFAANHRKGVDEAIVSSVHQ